MSKYPIITGILSYGMSGRIFHAPFLETNTRFKLKAVVERSKKQAQERYPNIISYDDVEQMLNDEEIELVVVNTPNQTHYDFAKKALLRGKHVLIEKPCAATSKEVKELFDIGRRQQRHVMVFQNRRWDSDFKLVKRIIDSGSLGEIIEFHVRFDRYRREKSPKLFKETKQSASGLTYDLGPHLLDQIISLFGKPEKSIKLCSTHREHSEVDDFFTYVLSYNKGLTVFAYASLLVAQPLPAYVVHGTKGSFQKSRADVQEEQLDKSMWPTDELFGLEPVGEEGLLTVINKNNQKQISFKEALKGNYKGLFNAVYEQLRKDKPYPITEEQILWQMELLEQEPWN
ncbi:Gfo/Idh/MocA family oxidoreductase [Olivibacter sp. SDN3]|uniref:Gfo/Idh/MocA family oxidoreductase n=1 Tax=Olivibacter sp. SDN3 TaxID=2764720 RepID=UPI001650F20D|nr:Gfo/Idh/MocA family oxidoreductase [Olivibacter sp. SDN3]QNL48449.1 Gfo/Idh/MocA family oxidoreductase [Olivibacter sp. SDN3]